MIHQYDDKIGDIIRIEATGDFAPYIECIVTEVNKEGRAIKMKAAIPDERLGRMGFIEEDGEYIAQDWSWSNN